MENSAMSLTSDYYVDPANYMMPDFDDFYYDYNAQMNGGWHWASDDNPYSLLGNIHNFFTGDRTRAENEYKRRQEFLDRAYSEAQLNSARRYEDSKYSRAFEDIQRAGYNPWLMLQSGLGAANVSPGPGATRNSAKYFDSKHGDDHHSAMNLITSAMKIVALLAMAA